MDTYVHIDEFGLPHVRLYKSGYMVDEISGRIIKPDSEGRVYVTDSTGVLKKPLRIYFRILMDHYFTNPLKQSVVPIHTTMDRFGFPGYILLQDGRIWCPWLDRYITTYLLKGYPTARLRGADGNEHTVSIHRMIALAWIPNPDPATKDQVNHIDGNPQNNSLSNLEWCTNSENQRHAARMGLHHRSVPPEIAHDICRLASFGLRIGDIAHYVGYDHSRKEYDKVRHIVHGGYHDISLQYNLPDRRI